MGYNAVGVTTQTAVVPGGNQTTTYTYGSGNANVPSNSRLISVQYPDAGVVSMDYNADGSLHSRSDQRNVRLEFAYDNAGRRTSQKAVAGSVPTGTDKMIDYVYTPLGQLDTVTSYSDAGSTVTSEVHYEYNGFGQIE